MAQSFLEQRVMSPAGLSLIMCGYDVFSDVLAQGERLPVPRRRMVFSGKVDTDRHCSMGVVGEKEGPARATSEIRIAVASQRRVLASHEQRRAGSNVIAIISHGKASLCEKFVQLWGSELHGRKVAAWAGKRFLLLGRGCKPAPIRTAVDQPAAAARRLRGRQQRLCLAKL